MGRVSGERTRFPAKESELKKKNDFDINEIVVALETQLSQEEEMFANEDFEVCLSTLIGVGCIFFVIVFIYFFFVFRVSKRNTITI